MRRIGRSRSLSWVGLLLVSVGVLGLLVATSTLPASIFRLWPLLLVVAGAVGLLRQPAWMADLDVSFGREVTRFLERPRRALCWGLVALGLLILPLTLGLGQIELPLLIVALGLYLIWRRAH